MKELFVWNKVYELGISEIDDQHKKWLRIMNKMYNSFIKKESNTVILEILQEMKEYTHYHFSTEERYFEKFGYEESVAHKKIHTDFIQKLNALENDFKANPGALSYKVMTIMQQWLSEHIMKNDKQYVKLFEGKKL